MATHDIDIPAICAPLFSSGADSWRATALTIGAYAWLFGAVAHGPGAYALGVSAHAHGFGGHAQGMRAATRATSATAPNEGNWPKPFKTNWCTRHRPRIWKYRALSI